MPISPELPSTQSVDESNALLRLLKRLFPFYCILVALVTFGYSSVDGYQIDGDAVAYMDIGDLLRAHNWHAIVNGYWHPLYPACLALGHTLFHATLQNELHAYYLVNYGIFLLQMLAICLLSDAIVKLRNASGGTFLLNQTTLRYLALALLVIANQRELSLGKVRPDALLQAFFFLGFAALLTYLRTSLLRYAALMGLIMGCAYLTKSFAFVLTMVSVVVLVAFRWIYQKKGLLGSLVPAVVVVLCFFTVAGPYVAALTRQKGRLNFGDSGALNYAWYVGRTEKMHLEPWQTEKFGAADVHLKHPEKELLASPGIYDYAAFPYGTYPPWFDATYFNDTIKPHMLIKDEAKAAAHDSLLVLFYCINHPEAFVLLALCLLFGAGLTFSWRPGSNAFWIVPVGIGTAMWLIYGTVNIEERYVTAGFVAIVLGVFALLAVRRDRPSLGVGLLAPAMIVLLAVSAPMESLHTVSLLHRREGREKLRGGWDNPGVKDAVTALGQLGVKPGDAVACIGWRACLYDFYWARASGVRILDEIYAPKIAADGFLEQLPNRDQAIATLRATGDKVLVGYFNEGRMTGRTPASEGWQQLGDSHLYALPLNLAPGATTHPTPVGPTPSVFGEE